jgi:hypothetical protein
MGRGTPGGGISVLRGVRVGSIAGGVESLDRIRHIAIMMMALRGLEVMLDARRGWLGAATGRKRWLGAGRKRRLCTSR